MRNAVIVDVDGTLCDISGVLRYLDGTEYGFRSDGVTPIKNFDMFHEAAAFCPPNQQALDYLQWAKDRDLAIIIVTARMERHRISTTEWLRNTIPDAIDWYGPLMRPEGDYRKDVEVKRDIYQALLQRGFMPVGAIDDNPNIIELWESLGIDTVVVPRPANDTTLVEKANKETP